MLPKSRSCRNLHYCCYHQPHFHGNSFIPGAWNFVGNCFYLIASRRKSGSCRSKYAVKRNDWTKKRARRGKPRTSRPWHLTRWKWRWQGRVGVRVMSLQSAPVVNDCLSLLCLCASSLCSWKKRKSLSLLCLYVSSLCSLKKEKSLSLLHLYALSWCSLKKKTSLSVALVALSLCSLKKKSKQKEIVDSNRWCAFLQKTAGLQLSFSFDLKCLHLRLVCFLRAVYSLRMLC